MKLVQRNPVFQVTTTTTNSNKNKHCRMGTFCFPELLHVYFSNKILREAKEQKSMVHSQNKKQSTETVPEEAQRWAY